MNMAKSVDWASFDKSTTVKGVAFEAFWSGKWYRFYYNKFWVWMLQKWVWILMTWLPENYIFWSEIGSVFGEPRN